MGKGPSVDGVVRRIIFKRDDYKCVKCGHHKGLQAHHIYPVYMGGSDVEGNLITLCGVCHQLAPDDPSQFFKWAIRHLPPDLDKSKNLTKALVVSIFNKAGLKEIMQDKEKSKAIMDQIDDMYNSLWEVYVSNSVDKLSSFFERYYNDEEEIKDAKASRNEG